MFFLLDTAATIATEHSSSIFQSAFQIIANNLAPIASVLGALVSMWAWYQSRNKIMFYDNEIAKSFYKSTYPKEYGYKNSTTISFVYTEIANLSSTPCTIGQFVISANKYPDTYCRATHKVIPKYVIDETKPGTQQFITEDMILKTPCTLEPYGFASGYIVFPYCPDYKEEVLNIRLKARIGKKYFICPCKLHSWKHMKNHPDHQ